MTRRLRLYTPSRKTNLSFFSNVETVCMDGTFQFCARFFTQMFTICFKNGHYIPLVFCLLPDKKYKTYIYTLNTIINECEDIGVILKPKYITIDFETAIHLAVNEVWPLSNIVGCRFHWTQAWYRNVHKLGLSTEYKNNSSIGIWIQHTFGLLFLSPDQVSDCFTEDLMTECPTDERLIKYCDYLVDNYISEDSVFTPSLWACNSTSMQLTTNSCESFHSHFNRNFYSDSPSILNWLNIIRNDVQTETYIKMNSIGIPNISKDRRVKKRQKYNEKLIIKYRNKQITRYEFIKGICRNFNPSQ